MDAPFLAISEDHLRPRPCAGAESHDRFRNRLQNRLDPRHARVRRAGTLDWSRFDETFGVRYGPDRGSPGQPTRGMVERESLQPVPPPSDEAVVAGWVENPYWQSCCGEDYSGPIRRSIRAAGRGFARATPARARRANRVAPARPRHRMNRPVKRLQTDLGRGAGQGTKHRREIRSGAGVCGRTGDGPAVTGAGAEGPEPAVPPAGSGS